MEYPIQIAAHKTGLSQGTLRSWERRYQGVRPNRDKTNRRMYSSELVRKLELLGHLIKNGYRIGTIAEYSIEQLEHLQAEQVLQEGSAQTVKRPAPPALVETVETEEPLQRLDRHSPVITTAISAVKQFNAPILQTTLNQAITQYGRLDLFDGFIFPLGSYIHEQISDGNMDDLHLRFYETHAAFYTAHFVSSIDDYPERPAVILTTPLGQPHQLGMIGSAVQMQAVGWRPVVLGTEVAFERILTAVETTRAQAVVFAIYLHRYDAAMLHEATTLFKSLGSTISVYFGGAMPARFREDLRRNGLTYLHNMSDLRAEFAKLHG